ncbi:hypothetical protein HPP92_024838 [Vanilla planifolia]|uniref:Myb/SANT-like DNA-binding domain-containing protein n=1 Tax=Vanilla planifolia TaxID=51239 RepID=A0A835U8G3_VANPL|nr:hypothetical protein HPP92_024838 [Vanilla planifolia]
MSSGNRNGGGVGGGVGGLREDCWSEGATEALVEAWGDRFLQLSRGNLRQKDWKEVADSVNTRQDAVGKPRKTDGQCKNRIDTLKKKYKLEKSKPGPSTWPFFSRLDLLVGSSPDFLSKKSLPFTSPAAGQSSLTVKVKRPNSNPSSIPLLPSLALTSWGSFRLRTNIPDATQSSREGSGGAYNYCDDYEDADEDHVEHGRNGSFENLSTGKRRRPWDGSDDFNTRAAGDRGGEQGSFRLLARAIEKIAEIYEKVERSKLQQTIELEKQRMEFEKELEIHRMRIFMETQLELEKMKHPKFASGSGERS